jgi:hypothetical protein
MRQALKATKQISLFALTLGLIAISATVAQAETGAYWEVGGTKIEGASTLLPKFNMTQNPKTSHTIILFSLSASKVELDCIGVKFVNGLLEKLGRATGKLHFENCVTRVGGTGFPCKPHSPGAALGLIETNALVGLLKLHSEGLVKEDLLELSPQEKGAAFLTFVLGPEGEEECLFLLGKNQIKGTFFLKDSSKELAINKPTHLLEEQRALSKLFVLNTLPVTIDGSFSTFLVDKPDGGLEWSGHTA